MAQPKAVPMGWPPSSFVTESRLSQNKKNGAAQGRADGTATELIRDRVAFDPKYKMVQAKVAPMGRLSSSFATFEPK